MRSSFRLTSIFALVCGVATSSVGCGGGDGTSEEPLDADLPDTSGGDTGAAEVDVDTGVDSTVPDTTIEDTGTDTGTETAVDTGTDTGSDTGSADTGPFDTGPFDTGSADTGPFDTGPFDTGTPDTGPADTGPACIVGGACDDGNACTTGEKFNGSCVCTGGTTISCDDGKVCTTDSCDTATGCKHVDRGDGTWCGAGMQCSGTVCDVVCTPGTACDDGNACTTGEKLNDTCVCGGGTTITCNDLNTCTTDSCSTSTGCVYTNVADDTTCGGTNKCKAGVCTSVTPPTVTITLPDNPGTIPALPFTATDTCQSLRVSVAWTASQGFRDLRWDFLPPGKTSASGGKLNGGSCGLPLAYNYYGDPTTYALQTSGTFQEYVSLAGLYSGSAGSGRWLWCTAPGSSSPATGVVSSTGYPTSTTPAAPGSPSVATLSDHCYYTKGGGGTAPLSTDTGAAWTLRVTVIDKTGATAIATKQFFLYK